MKKKILKFSNHMQAMVGQPYYKRKPAAKQALNALLDGMARYSGTSWSPVSTDGGYDLIYRQCPGACGRVWEINIEDKDTANWIVNEINQRSPFLNPDSKLKPLGLNEEELKDERKRIIEMIENWDLSIHEYIEYCGDDVCGTKEEKLKEDLITNLKKYETKRNKV